MIVKFQDSQPSALVQNRRIYDMSASVSDVSYDGLDLDPDQLGGNVTWSLVLH